ncbi:conserved hypothetical protein [Anaeromyxobacter dehalogenans 2CP-1]|uniref:Uncharacterized protein n=1 Tax=Anaeromyxobacter dehalogenans (strain ATCC BAA-258 / DSM 21875 / 2CP-1) TaxID=455488 RepID=B8J5Z2_ANAD2|nr:hypothetical protein [Anaeromyxobacter dehalogenans]ACL66887.1 conserved hypothetical protein [Anaeromyxobacter dehalogenans 2CP-1]
MQPKPREGPRWARGQKFTLSLAGRDAEEAYRAAVLDARGAGRAVLDTALAAWASPRAVEPGDGVLLGELKGKPRGLSDLGHALEDAGIPGAEVRAALDRLVRAGLAELVPLASQLEAQRAPPPVTGRW